MNKSRTVRTIAGFLFEADATNDRSKK